MEHSSLAWRRWLADGNYAGMHAHRARILRARLSGITGSAGFGEIVSHPNAPARRRAEEAGGAVLEDRLESVGPPQAQGTLPTEEAVLVHVNALRRYALLLVGDAADADDLVQECLLKVIAHSRAWRPVRDLRAYLFTTLHNVFVDGHRRRRVRANEVPVETVLSDLVAPPSQTAWLELRDLVTALQKLPAEQREIVLLVGVEGMTYMEAATVLGLPIGTVMSRLSRGREALRRLTSQTTGSRLRVVK